MPNLLQHACSHHEPLPHLKSILHTFSSNKPVSASTHQRACYSIDSITLPMPPPHPAPHRSVPGPRTPHPTFSLYHPSTVSRPRRSISLSLSSTSRPPPAKINLPLRHCSDSRAGLLQCFNERIRLPTNNTHHSSIPPLIHPTTKYHISYAKHTTRLSL